MLKANKPVVKKMGAIAKSEGKALKAGLKAVKKSNKEANMPVSKKMKAVAKTEGKALKAGLKAVKKSDKAAVKAGGPSMLGKKSGK